MSNWTKIQKQDRGTRKYSKFNDKCVVFVNRSGDVYITQDALIQLGTPEYVEVFEDAQARKIALSPSSSPLDYKVQHKHNGQSKEGARLSLATYMKEHKLNYSEGAVMYAARMEDGMLVVDISQYLQAIA